MPLFDYSVPVLVAGGGACGAVAALAAHDAGAEVLVIEQDDPPRGSTAMSQGLICAAGTEAQRRLGIDDSPEIFFADIMAKTNGQTDPVLARAIADQAGSTIDWLVDWHHLPYQVDVRFRPAYGHTRLRVHGWVGRSGEDLMQFLHRRLADRGIDVMLRAKLVDVIQGEGGLALGVVIERPDGTRENIGCDTLILATSGFGGNPEMVARNMPEMATALYHGHEGNRGAGIELGARLGGALGDMGSYQGYGMLADPHGIALPPGQIVEGGILLNRAGERFVDEIKDIAGMVHPVQAQAGGYVWAVYDEAIEGRCSYMPETQHLMALQAAKPAGTIEELADIIGVPTAAVAAALADAHRAREEGRPDATGRVWANDHPPRPPYRALKVRGALFHTQGGLQIDAAARVLRPDGSPLPNLFAGGGAARGVSGPSFWGYLPAMGICSAVTFGRLAGISRGAHRGGARRIQTADRIMSVARTLYEKLWSAHLIEDQGEDGCLLYIDRHLLHEVSTPQAFAGLRAKGLSVRRPASHLAVADHAVPTRSRAVIADAQAAAQIALLEANTAAFGIPYIGLDDVRQGIVHVIGPELGFTQPGLTLVCGDSHTATHGAFGALAFGIGASECESVLATNTLRQSRSRTLAITISGTLGRGVGAKDLILAIIGRLGASGGVGYAIEYRGPTIAGFSMAERMTLCNMTIEAGSRTGLIAPDETTFRWLDGRPYAPKGADWETALAVWRALPSDPDAAFDRSIEIDAAALAPQVTWGTSPDQVLPITGLVPDPDEADDEQMRQKITRALGYMDLRPGTRLEDVPIDRVFIGSCTNSRIEDLRAAAAVADGRQVAPGVVAIVVPGSGQVKRQAEAEGLDRQFRAAGFEWREPGCSLCVAMNDDRLSPGMRCVSTSNRNFEGRQGPGVRTHLVSPQMAVAAAVTGQLTDVRSLVG